MGLLRSRSIVHQFLNAGSVNLLSAVSLTAAAGTRTIVLDMGIGGLGSGVFQFACIGVDYTFSAATLVSATPTGSFDGVTYYELQSSNISVGIDTLASYVATKAGNASKKWSFTIANDGYRYLSIVFSGTGAGAGDLISVQAIGMSS